ncbi:MAG: HAD-IA family hydrolase [Solirubrobacteraceae bacterium]
MAGARRPCAPRAGAREQRGPVGGVQRAVRHVALGRVTAASKHPVGSALRERPAAILLDAMGTLVELEDPAPHLVAELGARGVGGVTLTDARRAVRAEIALYRAEHDTAVDAPSLAALRRRCAAVIATELGGLNNELVLDALLGAIRFRPYPEVPGVLAALRARGDRLAVVSNWDVSLHDVLARTGLRDRVDAVVVSATAGAAKPDPAIFAQALAALGAVPGDALHAGDDLRADVAGARAAGIAAVLVARDGAVPPDGVRAIASLDGLLTG